MTTRRCQCGNFYDKKLAACDACGRERHPFNVALVSQRWRNNLLAQAHHAKTHG